MSSTFHGSEEGKYYNHELTATCSLKATSASSPHEPGPDEQVALLRAAFVDLREQVGLRDQQLVDRAKLLDDCEKELERERRVCEQYRVFSFDLWNRTKVCIDELNVRNTEYDRLRDDGRAREEKLREELRACREQSALDLQARQELLSSRDAAQLEAAVRLSSVCLSAYSDSLFM